jgi:hypothetical protein
MNIDSILAIVANVSVVVFFVTILYIVVGQFLLSLQRKRGDFPIEAPLELATSEISFQLKILTRILPQGYVAHLEHLNRDRSKYYDGWLTQLLYLRDAIILFIIATSLWIAAYVGNVNVTCED